RVSTRVVGAAGDRAVVWGALAHLFSVDQVGERVDRHAGVLDVWGPVAVVGLGARIWAADEGGTGGRGAGICGDLVVFASARWGRARGDRVLGEQRLDRAGDRRAERYVIRLPAAAAPEARAHGSRDAHLGSVRARAAGVFAARAVGDV